MGERKSGKRVLFGYVAAFAVLPLGIVWGAWVTCKLWLWFFVPYFHVAPLPLKVAIGFDAMWAMYRHWPRSKESKDMEAAEAYGRMLGIPTFSLVLGAVVHWWMP